MSADISARLPTSYRSLSVPTGTQPRRRRSQRRDSHHQSAGKDASCGVRIDALVERTKFRFTGVHGQAANRSEVGLRALPAGCRLRPVDHRERWSRSTTRQRGCECLPRHEQGIRGRLTSRSARTSLAEQCRVSDRCKIATALSRSRPSSPPSARLSWWAAGECDVRR